jgi:DNA (cytosine-5)-methyltransferase 1
MKHGSLFSGIGGFDLAAEWMGWENVFHCEISEFPRKILKYHFPKSICYEDIKKTDFTKHRGEIDIISGGFPCQPYSNAGKRKGKDDDRHLWPEMLRVIREIQPRFVVGENVVGLLTWNNGMVFHEIITDLENEGYETQAFIIPACATNAPHRRDRVWFVAYSNNTRTNERMQFDGKREENDKQWRGQSQFEYWENGSDGNVADTDGIRGRKDEWWYNGESDVANKNGEARDVLHTNNTIKPGEYIGQKRQGQFDGPDSRIRINNFENFPTQSPICGGDDGIPTELDGITFSRWRNESIKGYGNAVVPQVVYQIFKAIEQSIL